MRKLVIYLDMDGVCADFITGAMELLNRPMSQYNYGKYNGFGVSQTVLWENIQKAGVDFWINLNPLINVKLFYKTLSKYGKVYFCTYAGLSAEASAGKIIWLQDRFGKKFNDYIIMKDKYLLANSNTLLIDDSPEQTNKFEEHGGNVYRWKSNWELPGYFEDDVQNNLFYLEKLLDQLV